MIVKPQGKLFAGIQISISQQAFLQREVFGGIHGRDSRSHVQTANTNKKKSLSHRTATHCVELIDEDPVG